MGGLSGLCWFFLDLGQFGGGRVEGSSIFLWLRLPLAFGGLAVVVVVGLGRGYTLQNPSFEEPPGRWEVKPVNGHRPSPFFLGAVPIIPAFTWTYCSPGPGERTGAWGRVAQP